MTDKPKNESEPPSFLLVLILFALVAIGGLIAIVIHDMGAAQRRMEYNRKMDQMEAETKEIMDRMEQRSLIRQNATSVSESLNDQYWRRRLDRERQWRERGY